MSNVIHLHKEEERADQAIMWITRIDRQLSDKETQAFQQWLGASKENQQVFLQYAKLWDKMDALQLLSEIVPEPKKQSFKASYRAMAASFVACVLMFGAVWQYSDSGVNAPTEQQVIVQQQFETTLGEQATFYMQDKTKVVLNTNSVLTVTYTDKQRLFELTQGEVYVEVAHQENWPLTVYAEDQRIQAVGTAFNVEIKTSGVELIVTEGRVRVEETIENGVTPLEIEEVFLPGSALTVDAGFSVELGSANETVTAISDSDLNASLSWQRGDLVFRGETLAEALQEVSRYTPFTFQFEQSELKTLQIAGLYKTDELDVLLHALEQNFAVQHTKQQGNTILLSKK